MIIYYSIHMKIITKKAISENYNMSEVVDAIDKVYKLLWEKKVESHERHFIKTKEGGDYMYAAATDFEKELYVIRGSSFLPWNKGTKNPIYAGAYMLSSYADGQVLAIIDNSLIINLRTGAKSAVAAKYLAKKESKTLGLIGLGNQAKTNAEAIATQFGLTNIIGYSRNPENWQDTFEYIKSKTKLPVEVKSKGDVIKEADILVLSTLSDEPLLGPKDLHPGQLIISLSHREEISRDVVFQNKTFVDYKPEAEKTFGPVKAAIESGYKMSEVKGDLAELASGKVKGRESDDEIIYFQSLGVTIEDLAAVEYLYEKLRDGAEEVNLEG